MQHLCYEEDFDAECDQSSHGSDEEEQFVDTPQQATFEHPDAIFDSEFIQLQTTQTSFESVPNQHREELTSGPMPTVANKLSGPVESKSSGESWQVNAARIRAEYEQRDQEFFRKLNAEIKEEEERYLRKCNAMQQVPITNSPDAAVQQQSSPQEPIHSHHKKRSSKSRTAKPSQQQSVSMVVPSTVAESGEPSTPQTRSEPQQSSQSNESDSEEPLQVTLQILAAIDPALCGIHHSISSNLS